MNQKPLPSHQLSDSDRRIIDSNHHSLRVYQVWKGSNIFFLGGRLIFGPDARSLYLTVSLIVAPVILFCSFVSQSLTKLFPHHLGILIIAIPAGFTAFIMFLLLLISGRDPGIIPRNSHPPEPDDEGDTSSLSTDWAGSQSGVPYLPPTKNVTVNGMIIRVKYCQTCMLYRPPRCSHCSICNNCVERFDHHCPWVGQCIGKRNYRYFFTFVCSTTLLCLYVFAFCWVNIKKIMDANHCNLWAALMKSPVSGILIIYTFTVSWFVGGLTAFHFYLVMTNQTTYENFRYRYDRKVNPYNLGYARNFREILLSRKPNSRNNFREMVKADSSSAYNSSSHLGRAISPDMAKTSFDMGKRQGVDADEFDDIQQRIGSFGGLERCGTHPRHGNWDHKGNWEMTPEVLKLVAEFEMECEVSEKENNHGGH